MSVLVSDLAALKCLLDYAYSSFHQIADPPSRLIGQQVGDPDEQCAGIICGENLRRGVVVCVRSVNDGPDKAAGLIVEVDEQFTYDRTIEESDDPVSALEAGIGDEPWH